MATAPNSLRLARQHFDRAEGAAIEPTDWLDLATYGFYALEAAVVAGALHKGYAVKRTHPGKVQAAQWLATEHGLSDVSDLLVDLNTARKSQAYGDIDFPDNLDADDVAQAIGEFLDEIERLLDE
jgi:hypothetical protein